MWDHWEMFRKVFAADAQLVLEHNCFQLSVCECVLLKMFFCQAVFLALGMCFLNHPYGFLG